MSQPVDTDEAEADDEAGPPRLEAEQFLERLEAAGMFTDNPEALAQLRALAAAGVHPMQVLRPSQEEEPRERVLETFDLEGVARHVAERGCRRIVVMCGAGISTSAGIPDFRTPGTGLYDNLQRFDLPRAESIFDLDFFRERPEAFYELCREMWPGKFSPTPTHYFLRLLQEKGLLLRCYSQNIDSLERQAGLSPEKLVAAHGNFDEAHVVDTEPEIAVPVSELREAVHSGEVGWQGLREKYGNLVKPKIVFFGEGLPERFFRQHVQDLASCDLLIVLGTSLVVGPFNSLVGKASPGAPRLLINRDAAGTCDGLARGFRFHLEEEGANWRDAWHQGDCDAGCEELARALGWSDDLEALVESKGSASVARAPWAAGDS